MPKDTKIGRVSMHSYADVLFETVRLWARIARENAFECGVELVHPCQFLDFQRHPTVAIEVGQASHNVVSSVDLNPELDVRARSPTQIVTPVGVDSLSLVKCPFDQFLQVDIGTK